MMDIDFKNANIGLAVAVLLVVLGAVLFHDNEDVLGATGLVAFAVGMAIFLVLNERDYRASRR